MQVDKSLLVFSHLVVSDSLWPHELQHTRPLCRSPSPGVFPSSCSLHLRYCPAMSSSDAHFSFCPWSFLASGTFPMSCLFTSDDQNTGASSSASVLPVNVQGWSPLRLTGLISLLSKGLSGVFSRTTVWRHQGALVLFFPGIYVSFTILFKTGALWGIQKDTSLMVNGSLMVGSRWGEPGTKVLFSTLQMPKLHLEGDFFLPRPCPPLGGWNWPPWCHPLKDACMSTPVPGSGLVFKVELQF